MKRAVVVGSGAGGAVAARELQGRFQVTIVEAGSRYRRATVSLPAMAALKRTGLLFGGRAFRLGYPAMRLHRVEDRMVLVRGIGPGGTTTMSAGNAKRADQGLRAIGIDLDAEFEQVRREVGVTSDLRRFWRPATTRLFDACHALGLDPEPLPKMGDYRRCTNCGRCVLGCPTGAKWDSRRTLGQARARGAGLVKGWTVESVVIDKGAATGVRARRGVARRFFEADAVVLAAGGLGTPGILERSGIGCEPRLFVDPVLCVAAPLPGANQCREVPMLFGVQRQHYLVAPYFDYLSYLLNPDWHGRAEDIFSVMVKLADEPCGRAGSRPPRKGLTGVDRERLAEAAELCTELLLRLGASRSDVFLGTLNAGHPGGSLPLAAEDARTLHPARLPGNLYVADATLLPVSLGNPPILTIMALATRVSRAILEAFG